MLAKKYKKDMLNMDTFGKFSSLQNRSQFMHMVKWWWRPAKLPYIPATKMQKEKAARITTPYRHIMHTHLWM